MQQPERAAPLRVAVLISGGGSNLQALIDAQRDGRLNIEIVLVASERADAYGLQRALQHNLAAACIPFPRVAGTDARKTARAAWEQQLLAVINAFSPDLLILAGFMRVLSGDFLAAFPGQVINQHPALLPDGGGDTVLTLNGLRIPALRGAHVVADALRLGLPITGCTIHRVTPAVDDGPVLSTAEVPILPGDDEAQLHERIKAAERRMIVEVVARLAADS
jgi:phosphoribosylglycinamide formyltransferase-1